MANPTAATTAKLQVPVNVVSTIVDKVKDTSIVAALATRQPESFTDEKYLIFNPTAEAEVIGEGEAKSGYDIATTPVEGKRFKVQCTTRVSEEFRWADEDARLHIFERIQEDQADALGRALDYVTLHAFNPKPKTALTGFTGLMAEAKQVDATGDPTADLDSLIDALNEEYNITGIGLSRGFANDLRKVRVPNTMARMYPDIPINLKMGSIEGINAAVSNTVSGKLLTTPSNKLAIIGDWGLFRWGVVRDMWAELIEYGDPDGLGDLKRYNQVAYRTEAVYSYVILDKSGFAVLNGSGASGASALSDDATAAAPASAKSSSK